MKRRWHAAVVTGNGGSFDTDTLEHGESGSHTFTLAGRFPYICTLHPSIKGTVVVAGTAGPGGGCSGADATTAGAGSPPSDGPSASPATEGSGGTLPATGEQAAAMILIGLVLSGAGAALRRLAGPTR